MKKFLGLLVLSSLVLSSAVQANHGCGTCHKRDVTDRASENCNLVGKGEACAFTPGPQVGGECLGGEVLEGCTIPGETKTVTYTCPSVKCPNLTCPVVTCPVHQCPSCPVCPEYEVETRLVEKCPAKPVACAVKKACHRCHRCSHCHARCSNGRCANHGQRVRVGKRMVKHPEVYTTYEAEEIEAPADEAVAMEVGE